MGRVKKDRIVTSAGKHEAEMLTRARKREGGTVTPITNTDTDSC